MIGIRTVTPKPRRQNPIARAIAVGAVLAALAFGPQQVTAHNSGYVGYGCSSYSGPYWDMKRDCYRGQETYANPCYWLLMGHYGGWWGGELQYQTWEALWCN